MEKGENNQNKDEIKHNDNNKKNIRDFINMINSQSNNINDNKNNIFNHQSLNNNILLKYPSSDNNFNNIYNNNLYNFYHPNMLNQINSNNFNNSFNNNFFGNNLNNMYNNNVDSITNIESNNNLNFNQNKQERNIPEKIPKNKITQKRNNYIPKTLLTFLPQNQNQNISKNEITEDYNMNLPNIHYNNQLFTEHKNSFDSQNSNQRKNSSNCNNSLNYEIDKNYRNIINDINININENEDKNNVVFKAYTYVFDENIEDVKEILTDSLFLNNNCPPSIIDNVQFGINNCSITEGNIISFRWKKFYTLQLVCTKTFSTKTSYLYALTLINLKPINFGSLEMTFKYYYNTCQSKTLFIIEYLLDKGVLSEVLKEEFLENDMNQICTSCEKILNQRRKEMINISSAFINTSKENAWNILMDLNKNRNMNYMDEYDLVYLSKDNNEENKNNKNSNDNIIKKGDCIIIKRNENNIIAKLNIDDIKIEDDKNEIIFLCEKCINDKNNENITSDNSKEKNNIEIINQEISLSLREISKNLCFCEFKHTWKDPISDEKIKILNFLKNNSLNIMKKEINLKTNLSSHDNSKINEKDLNINENKSENKIINIFNLLCPVKK